MVIGKLARSYWVPGYWYITYKSKTVSYSLPYLYWVYVPGYTVRDWYTLWQTVHVPGHSEPRIGWRTYHYTFWYPVLHYVPPRRVTYYTYHYVEVKVNQARLDYTFGLSTTLLSIGLAPPTGGWSLAGTGVGASSLVKDTSRNYNAIVYGGPAMETYVDGKLRMKQDWVNIEIFDYSEKTSVSY